MHIRKRSMILNNNCFPLQSIKTASTMVEFTIDIHYKNGEQIIRNAIPYCYQTNTSHGGTEKGR